jgi:hypothetical protein
MEAIGEELEDVVELPKGGGANVFQKCEGAGHEHSPCADVSQTTMVREHYIIEVFLK